MKKAYDLGINFFDTAENYTAGQAEIVMGKAIKHFGWKRSDLVISTSESSNAPDIRGFVLMVLRDQLGCREWRDSRQQPWALEKAHY